MEIVFQEDQHEIRHLIWQNNIPAKLILSPSCLSNDKEPLPLYCFIQRMHHPIFYYSRIHAYFEKFAPVPRTVNDIWLEWNGLAIPWDIPFGLTFDVNYLDDSKVGILHRSSSSDDEGNNSHNNGNSTPFYPIPIVVHYGPCTLRETILPIEKGKDLIEIAKGNFKFSLKEALLVRNQSTFVLTQVNLSEQEAFFNSFLNMDKDNFFKIFDLIFNHKAVINNNYPIRLPVRLYIRGYPGRIQLAFVITTGDEQLGDLLVHTLSKTVKKNVAANKFELTNAKHNDLKVICNGVQCTLDMPLLYFYKHFYHYDGFTYLAIQVS